MRYPFVGPLPLPDSPQLFSDHVDPVKVDLSIGCSRFVNLNRLQRVFIAG
jgi:hypothetical protein